jgi:hypothetical protein
MTSRRSSCWGQQYSQVHTTLPAHSANLNLHIVYSKILFRPTFFSSKICLLFVRAHITTNSKHRTFSSYMYRWIKKRKKIPLLTRKDLLQLTYLECKTTVKTSWNNSQLNIWSHKWKINHKTMLDMCFIQVITRSVA